MNVEDLFKIVIPNLTQEIVQVQKKIKSGTQGEGLISSKQIVGGRFVPKDTHPKKEKFEEQCCRVVNFAFTIVLKQGSYDIVTNCYEDYRDITRGIQCLIEQRNNLNKISKRIQVQNPQDS